MLGGTDQGTISAIESGARGVYEQLAHKLGSLLEPSGDELIIENRARAIERAIREGDRTGVLAAAKTIVKVGARHQLTPEGEKHLDDLIWMALKFAQGGFYFNPEYHPVSNNDGRAGNRRLDDGVLLQKSHS